MYYQDHCRSFLFVSGCIGGWCYSFVQGAVLCSFMLTYIPLYCVFLNLLIQCTLSKNYQILVHCTNNQVVKTFFNGKEINASVHVVEDFIVRIVILFCCFIFYSYSKNILYFLVRLMNKFFWVCSYFSCDY